MVERARKRWWLNSARDRCSFVSGIRLAVGAVRSGFDPFQPEPEHAPQVRFTLWHEPAPEPLGSGSPGLVRQVRVHGTEFR